MTLILTIFLLVLLNEAITWIGKTVIQDAAFAIYQRLFQRDAVSQQQALKHELLKTKNELLHTSAQDEFAKWAKLRRKVDKGLVDLEKLNSSIASTRTAFSVKFSSALWISTTGAQLFIGWWYRKKAVFYLPRGWFGPLTYWLSFPFAPAGSVSCGVWQMSCKRVIKTCESIVREFLIPTPQLEPPIMAQPVPSSGKDEKKAD